MLQPFYYANKTRNVSYYPLFYINYREKTGKRFPTAVIIVIGSNQWKDPLAVWFYCEMPSDHFTLWL